MQAFAAVKDKFMSASHVAWTAVGITEFAVKGALVDIRVIARMA